MLLENLIRVCKVNGEVKTVQLLTKKDEELVGTVVLMSRSPDKEERVRESLNQEYTRHPERLETGISLALFELLTLMRKRELANEQHAVQSIEILSQVLDLEAENWLAIWLKVTLTLLVLGILQVEQELLSQIERLLALQKTVEAQSYFITTYILLANYYYLNDTPEAAIDALESGLREVPRGRVHILNGLLGLPLLSLLAQAQSNNHKELAAKLSELHGSYFPYLKPAS